MKFKQTWHVTFRGQIVGTYSSKRRARNAVDRKDNAYGGYGHTVEAGNIETENLYTRELGLMLWTGGES